MVVIDPSLPCDMAFSMGMTSRPADLADQDPVRGHPQRPPHQLGQGDLALALGVGLPRLHRHDVGVGVGVPVQAQLQRVLDGDQPLLRRDRAGQRPQHGRLPDRRAAGDQQVLAGLHQRRQERGERLVDRAVADQLAQPGTRQPVAADRHARPTGDRLHREQPPAARQRDADPGRGAVEAALLDPARGRRSRGSGRSAPGRWPRPAGRGSGGRRSTGRTPGRPRWR